MTGDAIEELTERIEQGKAVMTTTAFPERVLQRCRRALRSSPSAASSKLSSRSPSSFRRNMLHALCRLAAQGLGCHTPVLGHSGEVPRWEHGRPRWVYSHHPLDRLGHGENATRRPEVAQ